MPNTNGLIECNTVTSTGDMNSNFYLRSVNKAIIGGGTIAVPPFPGGVAPITLTGALAGNVLEANKTYRIEISFTASSTGGSSPYTLIFTPAPTASAVIIGRQVVVQGESLTAGQSFSGWYGSALLKASATTSISASITAVYVGDINISIQSIVLTQLD